MVQSDLEWVQSNLTYVQSELTGVTSQGLNLTSHGLNLIQWVTKVKCFHIWIFCSFGWKFRQYEYWIGKNFHYGFTWSYDCCARQDGFPKHITRFAQKGIDSTLFQKGLMWIFSFLALACKSQTGILQVLL